MSLPLVARHRPSTSAPTLRLWPSAPRVVLPPARCDGVGPTSRPCVARRTAAWLRPARLPIPDQRRRIRRGCWRLGAVAVVIARLPVGVAALPVQAASVGVCSSCGQQRTQHDNCSHVSPPRSHYAYGSADAPPLIRGGAAPPNRLIQGLLLRDAVPPLRTFELHEHTAPHRLGAQRKSPAEAGLKCHTREIRHHGLGSWLCLKRMTACPLGESLKHGVKLLDCSRPDL
jgi:hypothetical protein